LKRLLVVVLAVVMLSGCASGDSGMERAMQLRDRLLGSGCSFTATVCADYGDKLYTFAMGCTAGVDGSVKFIVRSPETIAGIGGTLGPDTGFLTFDDVALAFPMLAEGEVTPVSGPWLLVNTLRGGYIAAAGAEDDLLRITLHDSYREDALQLEVWLDGSNVPVQAEILWRSRRVLTLEIKDFQFV
jgi:hypothetical protein